jgi:3'-phosphoadenosine 5'-phosphosulfate sulfotransferase (PAPS reductase)/FAD synthetase
MPDADVKISMASTNNSFMETIDAFGKSCSFPQRFQKSIGIIRDTLRLYEQPGSIALSFSGGKEACVLLYLLRYYILKTSDGKTDLRDSPIRIVHFSDPNEFPEVVAFLGETSSSIGADILRLAASYKAGMQELVERYGVRVVLMGVRRCDPYMADIGYFEPSSPSWPAFMRANPIIDWSYSEGGSLAEQMHFLHVLTSVFFICEQFGSFFVVASCPTAGSTTRGTPRWAISPTPSPTPISSCLPPRMTDQGAVPWRFPRIYLR